MIGILTKLVGLLPAKGKVWLAMALVIAATGAVGYVLYTNLKRDLAVCGQEKAELKATLSRRGYEIASLKAAVRKQAEEVARLKAITEAKDRRIEEAKETIADARKAANEATAALQAQEGESCSDGISLIDSELHLAP